MCAIWTDIAKANILVLTGKTKGKSKRKSTSIDSWLRLCFPKLLQRVVFMRPVEGVEHNERSAASNAWLIDDVMPMQAGEGVSEGGRGGEGCVGGGGCNMFRSCETSHTVTPVLLAFTWGFFPHDAARQPTTPFGNKANLSVARRRDKGTQRVSEVSGRGDDLWMDWNFSRHKRGSSQHKQASSKTR